MKRIRTRARFVLGAVVLVLTTHVLAARLDAQETRGKISGRVSDSSKAILPGATVTVRDVARNTVATATSNEQGLFQVNYLLPLLDLLRTGGTQDVVALLKPFDLDPTDPDFWAAGIRVSIGAMIDEAESLAKKMGKIG